MTNLCSECNQAITEEMLSPYKTNDYGLPLVLLKAVTQYSCECGTYIEIPNEEGLITAAAVSRAIEAKKLNGTEIKFLRKAMKKTAKEMAADLDVAPETFSRWENDKLPISVTSEKLLRMLVVADLCDKVPAIDVDIKDVARMKITGMAQPDCLFEMTFKLVYYKQNKRVEEGYTSDRIAA